MTLGFFTDRKYLKAVPIIGVRSTFNFFNHWLIEHCLEIFPQNLIFFFHQLFQLIQGSSDGEMRGHIQPADYSATTLGIGQEKIITVWVLR